jgi:acrylyl-CoA reductase (NADPH)
MTSRRSVSSSFQAWRVDQLPDQSFQGSEQTLPMSELAADTPNTALIKVTHSSLNYKDALSASGNKGVTRKFPHTPGIDAVGTIVETGENVIVTGYDLGMNTDGGFGEYICVPRDWCVPLPEGWSPRQSMVMGTAGLTAGLCVEKLLRMGATPQQGKVAVTGASGSVGSVAVEILSNLDFKVTAISGKQSAADLEIPIQEKKAIWLGEAVGRMGVSSDRKAARDIGRHELDDCLKAYLKGESSGKWYCTYLLACATQHIR